MNPPPALEGGPASLTTCMVPHPLTTPRRPHLPWAVPKKYYDLYPDAAEIKPPAHPMTPKNMYPMAWHAVPGPGFPTEWNVTLPTNSTQANRKAYYAAVSFLDDQVGTVLGELERLGFANSTLVVFHSDHGWQLGG